MFIEFTTKNNEIVVVKLVSGSIVDLLDTLHDSENTIDVQMTTPRGITWEILTARTSWTFSMSEDALDGVIAILESNPRPKIPAIKWVRNYVEVQTGLKALGLLEAKCLVEHIMNNTVIPNVPFYVYNKNQM